MFQLKQWLSAHSNHLTVWILIFIKIVYSTFHAGVISSPYFPVFGLNTEIYGANNYYTHRLMKICSICKEVESNVNEEELENFLESSATVEIEVNRKINKLKIRVKMKTEPVTASPPPIPRLGNGNRTKRYV